MNLSVGVASANMTVMMINEINYFILPECDKCARESLIKTTTSSQNEIEFTSNEQFILSVTRGQYKLCQYRNLSTTQTKVQRCPQQTTDRLHIILQGFSYSVVIVVRVTL